MKTSEGDRLQAKPPSLIPHITEVNLIMSYTASRFAPTVRFAQTLEQELADLGFFYDGQQVHDLVTGDFGDDRKVHPSDIARIAEMEREEFLEYIVPLSRGAKYIAGRIFDRCDGAYNKENAIASIDLKQLASDWAAKKELVAYLSSMVTKEALDYLGLADNGYAKLMNLGIRFDWQAYRFLQLYKEVCNPDRPWGSCYQPPKGRVKAIALTPNYNRLPLWVKQVLIQSPHWIQTERVGDIWKLIPAAKAWKVAPDLPKAIAIRVGEMPLWKRLAAKVAWDKLNSSWNYFSHYSRMGDEDRQIKLYGQVTEEISRPELMKKFWINFNDLCAQGLDAVLIASGDVARAITIKFPELDANRSKLLRTLLEKVADEPVAILLQMTVDEINNLFADTEKSYTLSSAMSHVNYWCEEYRNKLSSILLFNGAIIDRWQHSCWLPITTNADGLGAWLLEFQDKSDYDLKVVAEKWKELSHSDRTLPFEDLVKHCKRSCKVCPYYYGNHGIHCAIHPFGFPEMGCEEFANIDPA